MEGGPLGGGALHIGVCGVCEESTLAQPLRENWIPGTPRATTH